MDWRNRNYYTVSFDWTSSDMRMRQIRNIKGVTVHPYRDVKKQPDEKEKRGHYQHLIGVPTENSEIIEYELRKAERNDNWCRWRKIEEEKV